MADLKVLRTYRYIDKNPVIDVMRTALQDVGIGVEKKKLRIAAEITGISHSCLEALFHGITRNPQHRTVAGLMTGIGYKEEWKPVREIDIEKEREVARAWLAKQEKEAAAKPKKKRTIKPRKKTKA
jgi:hypothetical protein